IPAHRKFIEQSRPRLTRELLRQIRAAHAARPVDLLFSYFFDACVEPEAIDAIRAMGIKTVNWYCNGSYQLHLVTNIAPRYDWCLVPEKFRLADYVAMGANPLYCQEAANPNVYQPYALPVEFDVTFVGQAYGERPAYIRHLLDRGLGVRVWGTRWQDFAASAQVVAAGTPAGRRVLNAGRRLLTAEGRSVAGQRLSHLLKGNVAQSVALNPPSVALPDAIVGGPLSDLEMIQMYSRSKINLGFSTCGNTHLAEERILQIRLRDFEVPMSGGFYMVEYMEELEEFFEIGREIVCYTGPEDLADKIKYYLRHDDEREAIRRAGHERCLRDHSWHRRFETAFGQMGLS
ncbi:MAG: CgeB family protein, partial [Pyrinomonadaceae bacterium]